MLTAACLVCAIDEVVVSFDAPNGEKHFRRPWTIPIPVRLLVQDL
jgi:hypothetical protein